MNKKGKRYIGIFAILLIVAVLFGPLIYTLTSHGQSTSAIVKKEMKKYFDAIIPESAVIEKICDTYSGPPYEGIRLYTIQFQEEDVPGFVMSKEKTWNLMPFTEDLQTVMYGGIKDGMSYEFNLADKSGMPLVSNGIWKMIGKNQDNLLEKYSFDYKLAVLDLDTNILYYFEINT